MLDSLSCRIIVAAALILNLATGPVILSAQQTLSDPPIFTIRANTRLVMVDVVVTDKKGQPVTALKPGDFTVEENGKKQKLSVFVPPTAANRTAPTPAPEGVLSNHPESLTPAGPLTVLLLDAANSLFTQQAYARSQMLEYALAQGHAGRSVAVVALNDRLHVLQQFTSDPQLLAAAIRKFKPQEQILQSSPGGEGSSVPADMAGPGGNLGLTLALVQSELASFNNLQVAFDNERRTLITLEAMRSLARMLGGLPGRKNVVWLTGTLPFDLTPEDRNVSDAELLADLPGQGRQRSAALNGVGARLAEERMLHAQEIRDAEARLATANIAIYPTDLHALISGQENMASASMAHNNDIHGAGLANAATAQAASLQASQGTMREIAAETGGRAYMNENEIKDSVELAMSDSQASYALGYYPENKKWDNKFRKIKVKLDGHEAEVRYRKGYFAVDPTQDKNWKPEQYVAQAIDFNAPATEISFMALAKPTGPGKARVTFLVDAHTLTAEDSSGGKKLNITLYASICDSSGKVLGTRGTKIDQMFDAGTYQQIVDKGMQVPLDLEIPAGGTIVRLAVLDNKTGFIGTVSGPLGQ